MVCSAVPAIRETNELFGDVVGTPRKTLAFAVAVNANWVFSRIQKFSFPGTAMVIVYLPLLGQPPTTVVQLVPLTESSLPLVATVLTLTIAAPEQAPSDQF